MMMFDVTERRLLDRLLDSSPAKSERLMMMMIMLDWDVAFVTAPNFLFFFLYIFATVPFQYVFSMVPHFQ